ncbi:unnamed protein product [Arctia plantaginis]|uniref:Tc1-like transposase DDE domain-containing protein n=1 Tax=Arctia plantaginis TaxID=874455 RepID=A0A8S0Z2I0_ARCPL|nr:unnamed protein product [Arctia plantaginis]
MDTLASQNFGKFWNVTKRLNTKPNLPVSVGECTIPRAIANLYCNKFRMSSSLGSNKDWIDAGAVQMIRLPPYPPDLNPIEMAWASIKGYVSKKNFRWNTNKVMDLVKEKVAIMDASEWEKLC